MIPRNHLAPSRVRRTAALTLLYETVQGQTLTVDSQITADPGDEVTVDVSAPDEVYRVYVYNSDQVIVDDSREDGDATVTFDLSGYDPGSYVVATQSSDDGLHTSVVPLLVRGYAVDATAPDEVTADETVEVTIDVTATAASGSPGGVTAVLANDETNHTVQATETDGSYVATVDAGDVSTGEYTVYGAVQGDETAFGHQELVGIGEAGTLSISESAEATPTETETESGRSGGSGGSAGSGGTGGTGSGGDDPGDTPAGETNTTETDDGDTGGGSTGTETQTGTETTAGGGSGSGGSVADGSSPASATDTGEQGVAPGAITPNGTSTNHTGTTGADGPGFGPVPVLVALGATVAALAAGRRRRD